MRKHLKSIAAAIMAVVMLMSISTSAMAAEQVPAANQTTEVVEITTPISMNEGVLKSRENYFSTSRSFTDSPHMLIGGINISGQKNAIRHKLTGNLLSGTKDKAVVFELYNTTTGIKRSFTAIADGQWHGDWYYSDFTPGNYEVWVIYTAKSGKYSVEMEAIYTDLS